MFSCGNIRVLIVQRRKISSIAKFCEQSKRFYDSFCMPSSLFICRVTESSGEAKGFGKIPNPYAKIFNYRVIQLHMIKYNNNIQLNLNLRKHQSLSNPYDFE